MEMDEALKVLLGMVEGRALDAEIVSLMRRHLESVNGIRAEAQAASAEEYRRLFEEQAAG
jgi:hypothetical protein